MRYCKFCKQDLPLTEFYPKNLGRVCKKCHSARCNKRQHEQYHSDPAFRKKCLKRCARYIKEMKLYRPEEYYRKYKMKLAKDRMKYAINLQYRLERNAHSTEYQRKQREKNRD